MALSKHIFVATDFSDGSKAAVAAAAELAEASAARVTLFHVFDPDPLIPPGAVPNPAQFRERIVTEMNAAVKKSLDDIAKTSFARVEHVEQLVAQSQSAAQAICDAAEDVGADLIVISTHGRTGLVHLLIGSVAERVVRHAHCAVLAVRAKA